MGWDSLPAGPGPLERLSSAVRMRRVSAEELTRRSLDRIERSKDLGAVVLVDAERALTRAHEVDAAVLRGEPVGELAGLPLLVKDVEDVEGLPTTHGSLLFADGAAAASDGLVPGRLRSAGAIVVGKTNTPEFAFESYTANRVFGATVNPWGREWSPGGSSGGSGASLAAGLAAIATATDAGGSIRIPASLCGLAGLKPTNGVVGRHPIPPWMDLSTDGPLATSVADLRVLLRHIAGPVAGDPTALPAPLAGDVRRPARILASSRLVGGEPLPGDVRSCLERALASLERDLGLPVDTAEPGTTFPTGDPDDDWNTIAASEQAHALGRSTIEERADDLDPAFLRWIELGFAVTLSDYLAVRRRRFAYTRTVDELLGRDTVLVTPTLTRGGWTADGRLPGAAEPGVPLDSCNTQVQNLTGHPALSVPAGMLSNGLPFGLQFTGPRFADGLVLALGEAWEAVNPWPRSAPGFEPFGE